jgi:hypothetical protein
MPEHDRDGWSYDCHILKTKFQTQSPASEYPKSCFKLQQCRICISSVHDFLMFGMVVTDPSQQLINICLICEEAYLIILIIRPNAGE